MGNICCRGLNKIEKQKRKEVSMSVVAGLSKQVDSLEIVHLTVKLTLLGAAQQMLEIIEDFEYKYQNNVKIEDFNRWWYISTNLKYLFEFIEPCMLRTGAYARLSRPYKAKQFLLEYYAVGLRLCKLEGKVVPDYNTTFELNQVLEWSEEKKLWRPP